MTDYRDEYHELLRKHAEKLEELHSERLAYLELGKEHNALMEETIEHVKRATQLEKLIVRFGLCHPDHQQAAWWPSMAPKKADVPDTFEEWEKQQGGAE